MEHGGDQSLLAKVAYLGIRQFCALKLTGACRQTSR
ncbi:hypothetical protein GGD50_004676 [Rhizobium paranaense]|uniref:Uncharacterized protein n=1 Tax=Rhizobium paranaense TaxID=1650438 RepID=A0A7W8XV39_9HYPH|nr:hypothetical protein [Rhizobium paranaense]